MLYQRTSALKRIQELKKRIKIVQGGSSAGKTIAILLVLIDRAQREKGKLFSVVSETLPHLRRGAIRDFLSIMEGHRYFKEDLWNRTENIYEFETGTKIEFFSADSPDKVRGPRRDVLFINEANNVPYETYTQLVIRTNEDVFIDYNPVSSFWVHEEIIPKLEHDFLVLTYKDNEGLPKSIVEEIESRQGNKNFWTVYGLGQLGTAEGLIYSGWQIIDQVPHEAELMGRGLDFGYTQDPTAICDVYRYNGGYILDELCYQKGLSNKQIAELLKTQKNVLTVADSSEPKSIDEIRSYGVHVIPAVKGPGSVNQGIQFVQDQRISVTKNSTNLIKEYRSYSWATDRLGKKINEPGPGQADHLADAVRYFFSTKRVPEQDWKKERSIIDSLISDHGLPTIA